MNLLKAWNRSNKPRLSFLLPRHAHHAASRLLGKHWPKEPSPSRTSREPKLWNRLIGATPAFKVKDGHHTGA